MDILLGTVHKIFHLRISAIVKYGSVLGIVRERFYLHRLSTGNIFLSVIQTTWYFLSEIDSNSLTAFNLVNASVNNLK